MFGPVALRPVNIPDQVEPKETVDSKEDTFITEEAKTSLSINLIPPENNNTRSNTDAFIQSLKETTITAVKNTDPEELEGFAVEAELEEVEKVPVATCKVKSEDRTLKLDEELELDSIEEEVNKDLKNSSWKVFDQSCVSNSFGTPHLANRKEPDATNVTSHDSILMIILHVSLHTTRIKRLVATFTTFFTTWSTHPEQKQWQIAWYDWFYWDC